MEQHKKERGIILVEAIVAIGVLVTIFTAVMSLYMTSISGVRMTNDQAIATFLAQDAMEMVIAKRQYNAQNDEEWLLGMDCSSSNPCSVDFTDSLEADFPPCGTDCPLSLDVNTGGYTANDGTPTIFNRSVTVEEITSGVEAVATVRVWWNDGADTLEYSLTYNLYNDPN